VKVERLYSLENTKGGRDDEARSSTFSQAAAQHGCCSENDAEPVCPGLPRVLAEGGPQLVLQLEHQAALRLPCRGVRHALQFAQPGSCRVLVCGREHCSAKLFQVSLWDRIIEAKEDATFTLPFVRNKYPLQDQASVSALSSILALTLVQGRHLRGLLANLTLNWNVMPFVGKLSTGKHTFVDAIALPHECGAAMRSSGTSLSSSLQIHEQAERTTGNKGTIALTDAEVRSLIAAFPRSTTIERIIRFWQRVECAAVIARTTRVRLPRASPALRLLSAKTTDGSAQARSP